MTPKFKAWDIDNNEWYMDGDIFDLEYSGKYGMFLFDNDHPQNMRNVNLRWVQYTGLKDKNGKEIFEGDIRGSKYYNHEQKEVKCLEVMKWYQPDACFQWESIYGRKPSFLDTEIIGNSYENPELLKN